MSSESEMVLRDFVCQGCGEPLRIPQHSKGHVTCSRCKKEHVIENLVKNAEIAAKGNISSGIALTATPATLHRQLVSVLCDSPTLPLDAFDRIEVIREERHCVSAYCFECSAVAPFTYEKGVERTETYTVNKGDKVQAKTAYSWREGKHITQVCAVNQGDEVREKTHTDWHPGNSSVSVTQAVFASGNKNMAQLFNELYECLDHRKLIDIEELEFPADVITHGFDLPPFVVFAETVVPIINQAMAEQLTLKENADIRNVSMGGSSIQKEVIRVFVGFYRVVYKYGDTEYDMVVTGDGEEIYYEQLPEDNKLDEYEKKSAQCENYVQEKAGNLKCLPQKSVSIGMIFGFALCVISSFLIYNSANNIGILAALALLFITILGAVFFFVQVGFSIPKINAYNNRLRAVAEEELAQAKNEDANAKMELDAFQSQLAAIKNHFKAKKKALRGIYEQKVSGDASAFG